MSKSSLVALIKPLDIPKALLEGEKFIKWDEDSGVGTPITLRIDENGFYLHWIDQNKETDMLDIATIRDCRTGKQAKLPKDPKLRQIVTMGSQDTLEEKTVTLCYGSDFVNLTFVNFCCTKKEIAQLWTDELLKLAFNLSQLNASVLKFLLKAHTKLTLSVDKTNKIPLKNVVKLFAQHKDDKKKVKTALDAAGVTAGKFHCMIDNCFPYPALLFVHHLNHTIISDNEPSTNYFLEPGVPLPPPSALKRKIIIKNKKKHHHKPLERGVTGEGGESAAANGELPPTPGPVRQGSKDSNGDEKTEEKPEEPKKVTPDERPVVLPEDTVDEELESSSDDDEKPSAGEKDDKSAKETEAGAEISALVNYVQPVHFVSFEITEKKNRFYEMSSFDEKQATMLLKESPIEFVKYNKQQLSRVYPAGTRFDSSNFMPQVFWNAGCQLVALNFQTLDLAMQLNLGIFEYNQRCGYLLKPEFMRRQDRRFDPFAESTVDGIIAGTVSIHVLSGQFLTDKRVGTYVEVDMYGLPADTVRKRFRTKIAPNNGINPVYDEEPFVFKKVVLPELACLRITAYEESGKFIGHRVVPVIGLCPGYRHLTLRTECGQPLPLATLFLHVVVKDYVPEGFSDFAEALANPIKYQSEQDKRSHQLAVLTEDTDVEEERLRLQASQDPDKPRTKFYMSNKLVKRLSNKNMDYSSSQDESEGDNEVVGRSIPRSQSERMLAVFKDHIHQERELVEKYHELVYGCAQKVMMTTQSQQLKMLHVLLEKETSEVMRKLQATRRQEVKALAKQHRDRDELVRMKREVASSVVEKGVHERVRLTQLYEKKREELERQHNEVKNQLTGKKLEAKATLERELELRSSRVEQDIELEPRSSER
ncbi:unnamed protein product [Nesidiocoris tenuis]|uniref:Phosphoinositide phospholipase C n=1 Tax=Nesidiocoris tenuis TaxID=355587 RepID=A0A6H5GSY9_9HEMI|nr:unnamed protein product [Nesidiocoris tenuis]